MPIDHTPTSLMVDDGDILRVRTHHLNAAWMPAQLQQSLSWLLVALMVVGSLGLALSFLLPLIGRLRERGADLSKESPFVWAEFSTQGLKLTGRRIRTLHPTRLRLTGRPGESCVLWADTHCIVKAEMHVAGPHTPQNFRAMAKTAAKRLNVAFQDEQPAGQWDRWVRDEDYRRIVAWETEVDRDRAHRPDLYQDTPVEPRRIRRSHHGFTFPTPGATLRIEGTTLTFGRQIVDLAEVETAHATPTATLLVRSALKIERLRMDGVPAAEVCWLAREVDQQARRARERVEAEGTTSDVPQTLQVLRGRERT